MEDAVIAGAARTPMGGLQGSLAGATAAELGATAIRAAMDRAGAAPDAVGGLVMGCVLPAGQGQAPARQAGFGAGLGAATPALTLNKMCGSGMKAAMAAADGIALGRAGVIVAGGMESMTNAPYLLARMRGGARIGHQTVADSLFLDGLEDAYESGCLMGSFAEDCAEHYRFTREAQDAYALGSLERALAAADSGAAGAEIAPVTIAGRSGETVIDTDEQPGRARADRIASLPPAFRAEGTVTAANASSISDGAAALVLAGRRAAEAGGMPVRARIAGHATHAQAPGWFTTAPVPAARTLLERVGWSVGDVDLWEVNEAFAVVPMAFMQELGLPRDIVNIRGGACALGHPIGASGARIMVTLLAAMERQEARRGVAAICIGGGEATAIALERL